MTTMMTMTMTMTMTRPRRVVPSVWARRRVIAAAHFLPQGFVQRGHALGLRFRLQRAKAGRLALVQ
ncbi:hypothetical protein A6R71_09940 [Xanthomonas translucens pv. arrhenatheri]|nr:hypothetical protein A6R71_09940 [Xanthomonas translucens pv. arrhenatheri]